MSNRVKELIIICVGAALIGHAFPDSWSWPTIVLAALVFGGGWGHFVGASFKEARKQ